MLKTILIALAVIVIVFVIIVVMQPSEFRVARSTTISASPSAVFAQVNDFHKWEAWNPWGKIDPAMKQTYEGAAGRNRRDLHMGRQQRGRRRTYDDHGEPSERSDPHQTRILQALRRQQHRGVHLQARRQSNPGDVEYDRRPTISWPRRSTFSSTWIR